MHAPLHHCSRLRVGHSFFAGRDATGHRAPEPQPLRPILISLGIASLPLLAWVVIIQTA